MHTQTQNNKPLPGVGCEVSHCKYHNGVNHCVAQKITVAAPNATCEKDTFCSTFAPKSCC